MGSQEGGASQGTHRDYYVDLKHCGSQSGSMVHEEGALAGHRSRLASAPVFWTPASLSGPLAPTQGPLLLH